MLKFEYSVELSSYAYDVFTCSGCTKSVHVSDRMYECEDTIYWIKAAHILCDASEEIDIVTGIPIDCNS